MTHLFILKEEFNITNTGMILFNAVSFFATIPNNFQITLNQNSLLFHALSRRRLKNMAVFR